ncbi:hypothetical protein [Paenirhodobacter populi]|uniref:hypothetical protein n=1 Tax=Paenirhodobacter populi TaxID=2306993 RepID=UPI000FE3EBB8|nr:hypothetical protein [Sinirhodobacter populi]RWR05076.1 hypothetical protein D2T32_17670 [Sinirhodobacter populi]
MKYAAISLALLLAGCGSGNALDALYAQRAAAQCSHQGLTQDSPGWQACYEPAFAKARDVR